MSEKKEETGNWKTKLIAKWRNVAEQSREEDRVKKALEIVDYLLTHPLDERPICHSCGAEQENHRVHCPFHKS